MTDQALNRVLIVDDDPNLRRLLVRSLRLFGFAPAEASDGRAAVGLALELRPAAIVLDLMLPGESGLAVLERLRSEGVNAPVMILSGNDESATRDAVADSSADAYFVKPISMIELTERLRALIDAERPAR
jgi:DNA-binding response OmpR family regulator